MDYVKKMTWAEFRIRSFAYNRQRKREEQLEKNAVLRTREICYQIYVSNWMDSKRKPVSKEKYWSIGEDNKIDDDRLDRIRTRIKEAQEQYKKEKNG